MEYIQAEEARLGAATGEFKSRESAGVTARGRPEPRTQAVYSTCSIEGVNGEGIYALRYRIWRDEPVSH